MNIIITLVMISQPPIRDKCSSGHKVRDRMPIQNEETVINFCVRCHLQNRASIKWAIPYIVLVQGRSLALEQRSEIFSTRPLTRKR